MTLESDGHVGGGGGGEGQKTLMMHHLVCVTCSRKETIFKICRQRLAIFLRLRIKTSTSFLAISIEVDTALKKFSVIYAHRVSFLWMCRPTIFENRD
jgi:hypothetical protein